MIAVHKRHGANVHRSRSEHPQPGHRHQSVTNQVDGVSDVRSERYRRPVELGVKSACRVSLGARLGDGCTTTSVSSSVQGAHAGALDNAVERRSGQLDLVVMFEVPDRVSAGIETGAGEREVRHDLDSQRFVLSVPCSGKSTGRCHGHWPGSASGRPTFLQGVGGPPRPRSCSRSRRCSDPLPRCRPCRSG